MDRHTHKQTLRDTRTHTCTQAGTQNIMYKYKLVTAIFETTVHGYINNYIFYLWLGHTPFDFD